MSVKKRLEQFCEHRGIAIGTFCREARISNSYFSNVRGEMGTAVRGKIKDTFKDLNLNWLLTGEGEMLVVDEPKPVQAAVMTPYPSISTGDVVGNGNSFVAGDNNTVTPEIVIAEVAPSGEIVTVEQPPFVPDKIVRDPNVAILDWANSSAANQAPAVFNIVKIMQLTACIIMMDNNAMAGALHQGEFLFLKPFEENAEIIDGVIYAIETKTRGVLVRYLYDEGDSYLSRPKNTREFGDIRIPKDEVVKIHDIVFHGSTHLSSTPNNEAEMAKQLGQQSEYISSLIGLLDKAESRQDKLVELVVKKFDGNNN